jgi:hypothetical protein
MSWAPYIHPSGATSSSRRTSSDSRTSSCSWSTSTAEGTGARHLLRRLRRPAGALARRTQLAWTSNRGGGREGPDIPGAVGITGRAQRPSEGPLRPIGKRDTDSHRFPTTPRQWRGSEARYA